MTNLTDAALTEDRKLELLPCSHCGHHACQPTKVHGDRWGSYRWEVQCSSSHCCATIGIVADGWYEKIDGELNKHIPPDELYTDRLTQLERMWNRRYLRAGQDGTVRVPARPTALMVVAGANAIVSGAAGDAIDCYTAMLLAAPRGQEPAKP